MTVDSAYYPVAFANDGEVEYPVELESIGGVFQVYKVPDNGTARTLLTEDYHYTVAYEEHLDPIKKRAVITLAAPIASDAHLEVFRSTTIATDFEAEALKPFPSEQFEYTLDQICFIQQEIEGHLCDCRGDTYPPVVVPPVPPECLPYDCNAFAEAAVAAGMDVSLFYELASGPPYQFDSEYLQGPDAQNSRCRIIASWVGVPLGTLQVEEYYLPNYTSWSAPDYCDAEPRGLGIGTNPASTTDNVPRLQFDPEIEGMTLVLAGSISRSPSGTAVFGRRLAYNVDYKDGSTWRYGRDLDVTFGITVDSAGNVYGSPNNIYLLIPAGQWTAPGFFQVSVTYGDMYVIEDYDGFWGTIYEYWVDVTITTRLNDTVTTAVHPQQILASYGATATFNSGPEVDYTYAFAGTETILSGMAFSNSMPDSADAYLWYLRNFSDYEPPANCPVTNTETESVSSTPPVQGIFD